MHRGNPDLRLDEPHMLSLSSSSMAIVKEAIVTATTSPAGQRLVSELRTSHSESLHHHKLKFLDKSVDFWATYEARVQLATIEHNDGAAALRKALRSAIGSEEDVDLPGMLQRDAERAKQRARNAQQRRNEQAGTVQRINKATTDYVETDLVAYGARSWRQNSPVPPLMCTECGHNESTMASGTCAGCFCAQFMMQATSE